MATRVDIQKFLEDKTFAIVGVSRDKKKFGNNAFLSLKRNGYNVYPVNPQAAEIEGEKCYSSLFEIPKEIDKALLVVPPTVTDKVVEDALEAGIKQIWMQNGSESEKAVDFCQENGINVIQNECVLMFAEPVGLGHRMHRWVWGLLGKLPK